MNESTNSTDELGQQESFEQNWKKPDDFFVGVFTNSNEYKKISNDQKIFMLELGSFASLYSNLVDLSTSKRRQIIYRMGIKESSFNNKFSKLCQTDLLLKIKGSTFLLNPWVVYRGSKSSVTKARERFDALLLRKYEVVNKK